MKLVRQVFNYWCLLEDRFLPEELKNRDPLMIWKEKALYLSFLCTVVFGFFALVPSLILAYQKDLMLIFAADVVVYVLLVAFLFSSGLSLKLKAWISLVIIYALGVVLLFVTGYYGAGYIWLFGATMFGIVLFDNKYLGIILLVNLLILISVLAYIVFGVPKWQLLLADPKEIWVILTVNFMVVNLLIIVVGARAKSNIDKAVVRQVHAQASLIEEKDFSDYIIRGIPGLFFLFEQQKNGRLWLKRWNENLLSFFGYTHEELKNMNLLDFFEEKSLLFLKRKQQQLFENGSIDYEIGMVKKDGTLVPGYVQAYSFKKNNRIYVIGTAVDFTAQIKEAREKQRMQKSLGASQKAAALGTLSSGIAHDFNNILSGIIGYAELIRMAPDDLDNINKGVDQILKGSDRAKDLVQQILTFSRQAGSQKRTIKPYLIVKEAVRLMRSSIPATIEIKEKIESRSPIHADETQLHQVVLNLCTNAYHAMRETGGTLAVELSDVSITRSDQIKGHQFVPGDYLLLKIADTGHGMDKITLERIFEPYFTTKESCEGTGLGLAVVHGIVKEHHGHIQVDSRMDEGTCFYLYFPLLEASEASGKLPKKQRVPLESKNQEKIMVADDESSIRVILQSAFEDYGYYVEAYPNGEEALERFRESPNFFDLLITDVAMPKMPGDKLAREILRIRKDMPIIIHTGYSESFDEKTAYRSGIRKYLQKPADVNDILLAVQDIFFPG
ncbi:MAG: response regulator [Desulfobacter sp.]|nr:MAG: response regulator [Desulfobacter sp.]